ncbi:hypothetical protein [Halobacteriovorax sp. HLS]|uniref:hypothetical protein n=1 Tax=Halobacteriovorax sp. HLS TaxID=2234000 RepID=UPI000FDC259E|nr:hypothetical protein [Halobacteriovorax sp. HLS]
MKNVLLIASLLLLSTVNVYSNTESEANTQDTSALYETASNDQVAPVVDTSLDSEETISESSLEEIPEDVSSDTEIQTTSFDDL